MHNHRFARILAVSGGKPVHISRRQRQRVSELILAITVVAMACGLLAVFLLSLAR